ncbi:hypothetical protein ACRPK8_14165 [Exiguobacterium sp. TDN 0502]|uniref:hypothetical protein n=1 Tax=Exiguobacterium sp. TDN 0502 TaxID=3420731 RepID=UPI003D76D445
MKTQTRYDYETEHEQVDVPSETRLGYYFLLVVLPLGLAHLVQSLAPSPDQHHSAILTGLTFLSIIVFMYLGNRAVGNAKTTFFGYSIFLSISLFATLLLPTVPLI